MIGRQIYRVASTFIFIITLTTIIEAKNECNMCDGLYPGEERILIFTVLEIEVWSLVKTSSATVEMDNGPRNYRLYTFPKFQALISVPKQLKPT